MDDQGEVLDLIIGRAEHRFDVQRANDDTLDVKALGIIAADLALIALMVAAHDSLAQWWLVPTFALGVAAVLLTYVIWPRQYDNGPDLAAFYTREKDAAANDARRQMLSELLATNAFNTAVFPKKSHYFKVACVIAAAGIVGALASAIPRYSEERDGYRRYQPGCFQAGPSSHAGPTPSRTGRAARVCREGPWRRDGHR